MTRKLLWFIVPLALALMAVVILLPARPGSPPGLFARLVRQTTDASGDLHVFYEITNGTSKSLEVMVHPPLQVLHERTGWWDAEGWSTAWHVEEAAGIARDAQRAELRPRSAANLEIRIQWPFVGGSGLRGKVRTVKVETEVVLRVRAIAHRLGVPPRWQMLPQARFVELPEVALRRPIPQVAAATSAAAPALAPNPVGAVASGATSSPASSQGREEIMPPGSIQFVNASLRTVLDIYAILANAELEVDAWARASQATFSFTNPQALRRAEAVRLLEQVLEQQGGIAVKRVGPRHTQITCIEPQAANPVR